MRKLLCLLLIVFGTETYAASTPIKSKYDDRIQSQVYNALDVTKVYAKDGYSSVIVFAEDERISYKHTGFQDGWDITDNANFVLIKPLAVKQQSSEGESYFEPTPGQWNTNLFINTNKRTYSRKIRLPLTRSISPIRRKKKSNKSRNVKKINVIVNSKPLKNPCKVPKHRKIGIT